MGLESVLSIGERLQRLLTEADREAEVKVAEAQRRAEEMLSKARVDAERRRTMAQRGYGIEELLNEAEEKAKAEAKKSMKDYKAKAEALKEVTEEKIAEAVTLVLQEVLPR